MRVGLLAYLLHSGRDYRAAGVSTYIRQLLTYLPHARPDLELVTFHGKDGIPPGHARSVLSPVPTVYPPVRIAWEQIGFPLQSRGQQLDIVHGLVNVLPLASRSPSIVTVHDLAFLRHPERFHTAKVIYLRSAVRASLQRAHHVIVVSEHTRHDLIELLRVPDDLITVVYPGVDPSFTLLPKEQTDRFRRAIFGGRPYILHVGTLEPRKNVDVLIQAFGRLRRERDVPHVLALVGAKGWMYDQLFELVARLGLRDDVAFLDHVAPADLPLWYNCADLFAYPSAYEGFGLPVVEAMACGVPTITSSSSSLAEVSGGACLLVEPGSMESLQMALGRVLTNQALTDEMRRLGRERASLFDWRRTAAETAAVYDRVWDVSR